MTVERSRNEAVYKVVVGGLGVLLWISSEFFDVRLL